MVPTRAAELLATGASPASRSFHTEFDANGVEGASRRCTDAGAVAAAWAAGLLPAALGVARCADVHADTTASATTGSRAAANRRAGILERVATPLGAAAWPD